MVFNIAIGNSDEAQRIIEEVNASVSRWKSLAKRLGIAKREMEMFEQVYTRFLPD